MAALPERVFQCFSILLALSFVPGGVTAAEEVSDDARRILQYIKRKEGSRWEGDGAGSDSSRDW